MKFIFFLIVLAALAWAGMNVDFNNIKPNTTETFKKEKTILKVNEGRERRNQEVNNAINGN